MKKGADDGVPLLQHDHLSSRPVAITARSRGVLAALGTGYQWVPGHLVLIMTRIPVPGYRYPGSAPGYVPGKACIPGYRVPGYRAATHHEFPKYA
eukprot:3757926-Rhodomonas_salina.1